MIAKNYRSIDDFKYDALESVNVCNIFEDLKYQFQGIAQALEIDFTYVKPKKPLFVRGNARRIADAISGIVHNSITFCTCGASISLMILSESDRCFIVVSDNGIGIEESMLEKIFEFDFPRRKIQSFSENLFDIRKYIREIDGDVWAETVKSCIAPKTTVIYGATFIIMIPITSPDGGVKRNPV